MIPLQTIVSGAKTNAIGNDLIDIETTPAMRAITIKLTGQNAVAARRIKHESPVSIEYLLGVGLRIPCNFNVI